MIESVVQAVFQNPEVAVTLAYLAAIALSWNRVPATVPFISNLYVTGALVLAASLFYFFAVPDPSTGIERLLRKIGDAVFFGIAVLGFLELVKIKQG